MRIAEIYKSIQGEGLLTGAESVFVRASGCNLRCGFCDTPYTSWRPEGQDLPIEEVLAQCDSLDAGHVVITGGEPMLFAETVPLAHELSRLGFHVTIETAGTRYLPVWCDLMSISPKLSNSTPRADRHPRWARRHEQTRRAPEVIRRLMSEFAYQVKFVVDTPADCQEIEAYLTEFPEIDRDRVMLMPEGTEPDALADKTQWLAPYCEEHGLGFCPRKQIEWFGLARGT